MKTDYDAEDDILILRFTAKPVAREISQDWNLNIAYAVFPQTPGRSREKSPQLSARVSVL